MRNWLSRRLERAKLTITVALCGLFLLSIIVFAILDLISSLQEDNQRVQTSTLTADLSNFLLSVREPDGTSLLDNPSGLSAARRELRPTIIKRSFYTYFLTRANAKSFAPEKVVFELPRACTLTFDQPSRARGRETATDTALQACVGVVPNDPTGRYLYFAIRYPVDSIRLHSKGQDLRHSDRVELRMKGLRDQTLTLVYETPSLAKSRYPSQLKRFAGSYEMAAFLGDSTARPTTQLNAQAVETTNEASANGRHVTILGRIDAGLLDSRVLDDAAWPSSAVLDTTIGIATFAADGEGGTPQLRHAAPVGTDGEASASLQKAYVSQVPSGAKVEAFNQAGTMVWSSESLALPNFARHKDFAQRISDWWTPKLFALLGQTRDKDQMDVALRFRSSDALLDVRASAPLGPLPDVATRAFLWLSAALMLSLVMLATVGVAMYRLLQLSRWATISVQQLTRSPEEKNFGKQRDEIATLGRSLKLLFTKQRKKNERLSLRAAADRQLIRLQQTLVTLRQDQLESIGHEIRSPLQDLLISVSDPAQRAKLERMERAIDALIDADSVEDGFNSMNVIPVNVDVSRYLVSLVSAKRKRLPWLDYDGTHDPVFAQLDEIQFEQVIDHLLNNASRYRADDGRVAVRLLPDEDQDVITVEVYNDGPLIEVERLESIFKYHDGDRMTPFNRGIGLFAVRKYLYAMNATIRAENRPAGVAMVIELQRICKPVPGKPL
jgi:signal transduction histidine kinase